MDLNAKLTLILTIIGTSSAVIMAILSNITNIKKAFKESGLGPVMKSLFLSIIKYIKKLFKNTTIVFFSIILLTIIYLSSFFWKKTYDFIYKKAHFSISQIEDSARFWALIKESVDWNKNKSKTFLGNVNFWLHLKPDGNLSITYSHGGITFYPDKGDTKNFLPVGPITVSLNKDIDECSRLKEFFYNPRKTDNRGKCFQNQTSDDYRCSVITDFINKANPLFLAKEYKMSFVCGYALDINLSYVTIIIQENNQSKDLAIQWLKAYGQTFNMEYNLSIE